MTVLWQDVEDIVPQYYKMVVATDKPLTDNHQYYGWFNYSKQGVDFQVSGYPLIRQNVTRWREVT